MFSPITTLIEQRDKIRDKYFNYKLSLFTFSSFIWIYDSYIIRIEGETRKCVPTFISDFLTPIGLAHLVMQIGSTQKDGLLLKTRMQNISDLNKLTEVLKDKYNLDSTILFLKENKFA